jgi:hypothetical protein
MDHCVVDANEGSPIAIERDVVSDQSIADILRLEITGAGDNSVRLGKLSRCVDIRGSKLRVNVRPPRKVEIRVRVPEGDNMMSRPGIELGID